MVATVALKVDLKSKVALRQSRYGWRGGVGGGRSSKWRDSLFSGDGKVPGEGQGHSE